MENLGDLEQILKFKKKNSLRRLTMVSMSAISDCTSKNLSVLYRLRHLVLLNFVFSPNKRLSNLNRFPPEKTKCVFSGEGRRIRREGGEERRGI